MDETNRITCKLESNPAIFFSFLNLGEKSSKNFGFWRMKNQSTWKKKKKNTFMTNNDQFSMVFILQEINHLPKGIWIYLQINFF